MAININVNLDEILAALRDDLDFTGNAAKYIKVNATADGFEFSAVDPSGLVPYTGATTNVDLGEFELKAGQLELDQTPTGTAGVAVTRWNDTLGTTETTLKGGNVVLKHGRDMFERIVNKTGIQLTRAAYQAVKIDTAQGQRLAVDLAQANNDNNSADTIGLVVETIDNNQEGIIYTVGEIDGINTTGSLQGETWADGDVLYLSPTTAGRITNVKPVAPQHLVVIGYVVYAHANNGKIYVKVMNGWELGELHDVDTTGATNGQVLKFNGTIWTPATDSGGISSITASAPLTGGTITTSGTIGITQSSASTDGYLSSTDWTTFNNKQPLLTNPVTGTGASGQVGYWTGANAQAGSNNLFWDNANGRLGIGTILPSNHLHIEAPIGGDGFDAIPLLFVRNTANTATVVSSMIGLAKTNGNMADGFGPRILFSIQDNTFGDRTNQIAAFGAIRTGADNSGSLIFQTATNGSNTQKLQIFPTGNLLVQNGGTFTDAGFRLDVNGTARVQGDFTVPNVRFESTKIAITSTDLTISNNLNNRTWVFRQGGALELASVTATGDVSGGTGNFPVVSNSTASLTFYDGGSGNLIIRSRNNGARSIILNPFTGGSRSAVVIGNTVGANGTLYSGALVIQSTTQGFLPPVMTSTQRNAIASPDAGLIAYQSTNNALSLYNGTAWADILTSSNYDGLNIGFGTTTGTKIGTATSQKIGFWNATPNVQPTTAITAGAFVANTSGITDDTATFDGYTIGQVVAALRRIGALA